MQNEADFCRSKQHVCANKVRKMLLLPTNCKQK